MSVAGGDRAPDRPDVSVVIPAYNEAESLRDLLPRVAGVLRRSDRSFEIIVVDDGSVDETEQVIREASRGLPELILLGLRRNFGKSAALATGFRAARGAYVVTLDADLQDDPEEIPLLLEDLEGGASREGPILDLVSGWKKTRHDPWTKTLPSRLFNRVTAVVTSIPLHDFNCGLKAYRGEVVKHVRLYGEMHRYIPVLAHREGYRVGEREVRHHPRRYGVSKFGGARFINGFLDLLEVMFLAGSGRTPLHLFGRIGTLCLLGGGGLLAYMFVVFLMEGALRVRPLLLFGVILIILGIQFISIGLLAELIHAPASRSRIYPLRVRVPETGEDSAAGARTGQAEPTRSNS